MERAVKEIGVPLMLNLIEGGKTPLVPVKEAEAMGFKMIVPALSALFAAARGMYEVMSEIRKEGVSDGYLDRLFTFRNLQNWSGWTKSGKWRRSTFRRAFWRKNTGERNG